jgi:hypothetical protein
MPFEGTAASACALAVRSSRCFSPAPQWRRLARPLVAFVGCRGGRGVMDEGLVALRLLWVSRVSRSLMPPSRLVRLDGCETWETVHVTLRRRCGAAGEAISDAIEHRLTQVRSLRTDTARLEVFDPLERLKPGCPGRDHPCRRDRAPTSATGRGPIVGAV